MNDASQEGDELVALVGEELAGFRLVRLIGQGGMAAVFRGENALNDRLVRAIKVIRPELASARGFAQRFVAEAEVLESLEHPNVVRFYGIRKDRGFLLMELELLVGRTFREEVRAGLSRERAVAYLVQATDGLAAAHARGVLHRDIKPDNLFVTRTGVVKVLDFGIARAIEGAAAAAASQRTAVGMLVGTPAYMAPEVCNGEPATASSDVYALGLTLYEALVGHHPFQPPGSPPKSTTQLMMAHVGTPIPRVPGASDDPIASLVERATAKDPATRFVDASAFAAHLRGAMSASSAASTQFEIPSFKADRSVEVRASDPVQHEPRLVASANPSTLGEFARTPFVPAAPVPPARRSPFRFAPLALVPLVAVALVVRSRSAKVEHEIPPPVENASSAPSSSGREVLPARDAKAGSESPVAAVGARDSGESALPRGDRQRIVSDEPLSLPAKGGPLGRPKSATRGIEDAGPERVIPSPTGHAVIGPVPSPVRRVVAGMRPQFGSCYNKALQSDPSMAGKVSIAVKIGPGGEVESAEPIGNEGLSSGVISCLQGVARRATFDPPVDGQSSALSIPIVLELER